MTGDGKGPAGEPAGPGGARVVAMAARLSRSAVGAGDGRGDQADVGVVEGAQDAGEVDGDVVVAEAGCDSQDAGFGGRAAELVVVEGGNGVVPVDPGVGVPVVAGAGVDVTGGEVGSGEPGAVCGDQFGGCGVAGEAGGGGDQGVRQ